MKKLNAGCGKTILEGWDNLDKVLLKGVTFVSDLEEEVLFELSNRYDEILLSHTFEHFKYPLTAMHTLWQYAKPDCHMTVRCPWGGSHIAFEDPTHVRQVFLQTMYYFSQTAYNAADYNYRGDWHTERQIIVLDSKRCNPRWDLDTIHDAVLTQWNMGVEIISELRAIKPARAPGTPSEGYKLEFAFDYQLQESKDESPR